MTRIDITGQFVGWNGLDAVITEHEVALKSDRTQYTGVVYDLHTRTMIGSYIDFPGHIKETDDGVRGDNVNLADFYGIDCAVIHLDRANCPGGISAADLEAAYGGVPDTPAVIINALGSTRSFDIPQRSVYLELDAVEWLKKTPCKLLASDVYESTALEGVFLKLFEAGISTICEPANLDKLTAARVKLTVMFPKMPITQLPCAMVAEF
ncbi:MAG: cyclase family protein [Lentisphaerae bacterium]|nr:cyclase family protein [Lentisphaerota bacterium]